MATKSIKDVRAMVKSKDDKFIRYIPAHKENGKHVNSKVEFKCVCGRVDIKVYNIYAKGAGHCRDCTKKHRSIQMTLSQETIKTRVETLGIFTVLEFENDTMILRCTNKKHISNKSWPEFRQRQWCVECAKGDLSLKFNGDTNYNDTENVEESLEEIEKEYIVPDNCNLIREELDGQLLIRHKNHVFRCDKSIDIECPEHDYTLKSLNMAIPHNEIDKRIKQNNDTLLSKYFSKTTLLEIQCGECSFIYYKTYNMYECKDSKCPNCVIIEAQKREAERRLRVGSEFRKMVESYKWTWCDDEKRYEDQTTKFAIICDRGHNTTICARDFRYRDCYKCANIIRIEKLTLKLDEVLEICRERGFELLNNSYVSTKSNVRLRCLTCRKIVNMKFSTMKYGKCPECNSSRSAGELHIRKVLELNCEHINYFTEEFSFGIEHQKTDDWFRCRDKNALRYDFRVILKNGVEIYIEYDGGQHFKVTEFFGGEEAFKKRRNHDLVKSLYCDYNNKYLLRISYRDFREIPTIIENYINFIVETAPRDYSSTQDYVGFKRDYVDFEPPNNLPD